MSSHSFAVLGMQMGGWGDISAARQIANLLEQTYPSAMVSLSLFHSDLSCMERKTTTVLTKEQEAEWRIESIESIKDRQFSAIVVFPYYGELALPNWVMSHRIIRLCEYGFSHHQEFMKCASHMSQFLKCKVYLLGLTSKERGVLIPQDLYAHGHLPAVQRLTNLSSLPAKWVKCALGEPYSNEAIDQFIQKNGKLFSAYAHQAEQIAGFIGALCRVEKKSTQIVVWILKPRIEGMDEYIRSLSGMCEIASCEIYYKNGDKTLKETHSFYEGNRTLKLLFAPLDLQETRSLFKASEREALATGNQSFIECLMLRKHVVYGISQHTIPFIESFQEKAAAINPKFGPLISNSYKDGLNLSKSKDLAALSTIQIEMGMAAFFKSMNDPKLCADWDRLVQAIHDKNNFKDNLAEIVEESLKAPLHNLSADLISEKKKMVSVP